MTASFVPVAIALAWLVLPGLALGAALGLRGWLLPAAAPALTFGFVSAASVGLATAGVPWRPLNVGLACGAVALVLGLAARPWRTGPWRTGPPGGRWTWYHHGGIAILLLAAGALGARSTIRATGELAGVNQTWDAFFHAGAVRLITETGDANPAALAEIAAQAAESFFTPNTYHALAALVAGSSGLPVVVVLNAIAAGLPLLFGAALVGFFRVTTGRPAHAASVALLSAAVAAVPYHLTGYGALLPYGATLVMLPGVLALVAAVLRNPGWRLGVALAVAASGLLGGHPQVAFLAAIAAAAQLGWHLAEHRRLDWRLVRTLVLSLAVCGALSAVLLRSLVTVAGEAVRMDWPAYTNPGGALGDLLLFNSVTEHPQLWFVPFFAAGLWAILSDRGAGTLRPLLAAGAVFAVLYIMAGAYDTPLTLQLTSLWWNDRHRLAAAFAVVAVVVSATGLVLVRDKLLHLAGGLRSAAWVRAVVLVLLLGGFVAVTEHNYAATTRAAVATGYGQAPTLSDRERAGLAALAEIVATGGGGTVINDPHDGCGWAYPLHGTPMVFPTPLTGPFNWSNLGYDRMRLYETFDELDSNPQVEADAAALRVRWVVLCTGFIRTWQGRIPGLDRVAEMESATLEYANGAVSVYRVHLCPDVSPAATRPAARTGCG